MALTKVQIRKAHRFLAPLMLLPLLVTLLTGSIYQIASLTGAGGDFYWLIEIHKGLWGPLNLEIIYPFLNALGLLVMVVTGFSMWLQMRPRTRNRELAEK